MRRYFGRSPLALAVVAAGLVMAPAVANAASITYTTTSPNQAMAILVTTANTITLTLKNFTNNPTDAADLLTGFGFNTAITTGSLTLGTGLVRNVAGNGTFTDSGTQTITDAGEWGSASVGSWSYFISALPNYALIGAPGGAGNNYADANASIAGNGPHNPFVANAATFVFTVLGVNANSVITGATFRFGTTAGSGFQNGNPCLINCGSIDDRSLDAVPEPASMLLVGTGLAGAVSALRRRRKV